KQAARHVRRRYSDWPTTGALSLAIFIPGHMYILPSNNRIQLQAVDNCRRPKSSTGAAVRGRSETLWWRTGRRADYARYRGVARLNAAGERRSASNDLAPAAVRSHAARPPTNCLMLARTGC